MKKINYTIAALLLTVFVLSGCFKDHVTHTYTFTVPVYKTLSTVREEMKSGPATAMYNTGKIYVQGHYIFLNERGRGIHIIDNSNPANPRNISFIPIPGNEDIAVKGNTLYADAYGDLISFDISDPRNIVHGKILQNIFPDRAAYYFNGNTSDSLILTDYIIKDTTIDLSNPPPNLWYYQSCATCGIFYSSMAPTAASASTAPSASKAVGGSMARFTVVNDYLYTVSNMNLTAFDVSSSNDPALKSSKQLAWGIETIYPFEDKLFIGSNNGVYVFEIASDPANPASVGQFTHARACDPVITDGNYAYVTLSDGTKCQGFQNQMDIVDVSRIRYGVSSLVISYQLKHPKGLSKDGNTLFVCDDQEGLKIYDASDVRNLKMISNLKNTETFDVITVNGLAIVVGNDGLYQYDYTDLQNIRLLSKLSTQTN